MLDDARTPMAAEDAAGPGRAADRTGESSSAFGRAGPRVTEREAGDDAEETSAERGVADEPAEPPSSSARAIGNPPSTDPTPSATARAPTRPTYRAQPGILSSLEPDTDTDMRTETTGTELLP